jgi:hypothetical protein
LLHIVLVSSMAIKADNDNYNYSLLLLSTKLYKVMHILFENKIRW